jgi:hypothetical protein
MIVTEPLRDRYVVAVLSPFPGFLKFSQIRVCALPEKPLYLHENGPWRPFVLKNVSPIAFWFRGTYKAVFLKKRQREKSLSLFLDLT